MGTGEITGGRAADSESFSAGEVLTATGRLSIARKIESQNPGLPFSPSELARLDEALVVSNRSTGLEFGIYLGDLGEETRKRAEALHANLGDHASEGVLIAVSPAQRQVEIVTGEEAYRRVPDRSCQLATMSMVASFKEGEFVEGLLSALRMLSDAAGSRRPRTR